MDFLRLYLGQITGLALVVAVLFAGAAVAARYFPDRPVIRTMRNICIAAAIAGFVLTLIPSITMNRVPRGRVDRTAVDQDQKAFEQRHSSQTR